MAAITRLGFAGPMTAYGVFAPKEAATAPPGTADDRELVRMGLLLTMDVDEHAVCGPGCMGVRYGAGAGSGDGDNWWHAHPSRFAFGGA